MAVANVGRRRICFEKWLDLLCGLGVRGGRRLIIRQFYRCSGDFFVSVFASYLSAHRVLELCTMPVIEFPVFRNPFPTTTNPNQRAYPSHSYGRIGPLLCCANPPPSINYCTFHTTKSKSLDRK